VSDLSIKLMNVQTNILFAIEI